MSKSASAGIACGVAPIGADFGGVVGRGQNGDAVAAVDQALRDVQQRTDVPER